MTDNLEAKIKEMINEPDPKIAMGLAKVLKAAKVNAADA